MNEVVYKDDNACKLDAKFEWSFFESAEYETKHLVEPIKCETGRTVKFEPPGWCYELIATTYSNRLVPSPPGPSTAVLPRVMWKLAGVATRVDIIKIYHRMNLSASDDF
jgi:hypothetical protein